MPIVLDGHSEPSYVLCASRVDELAVMRASSIEFLQGEERGRFK